MAHGYRNLQIWDQWLATHHLGQALLKDETKWLNQLLINHFSARSLLVGVPNQYELLQTTSQAGQTLISPFVSNQYLQSTIEADFRELPIQSGSVDLVLLPHVLERIDSPRQVLNEICRILRPEGLVVIIGFRPYGWWDFKKKLMKKIALPWFGNYIPMQQIENWLRYADFLLVQHRSFFLRPPLEQPAFFDRLAFLDKWTHPYLTPLNNVYIVCARAKVVPLTPIRFKLRWKPALTSMPKTLIGHSRSVSAEENI